jgi:hypothetical protein
MRRILTLTAVAAVFSVLGFAESWSGRLVDATCISQQGQQSQHDQSAGMCNPTSATTSFAIETSGGKTYQLDANGNQKAQDALRNRAERQKNPDENSGEGRSMRVNARITGTMDGDTIKVDTLDVR